MTRDERKIIRSALKAERIERHKKMGKSDPIISRQQITPRGAICIDFTWDCPKCKSANYFREWIRDVDIVTDRDEVTTVSGNFNCETCEEKYFFEHTV